MRGQRAPDTPFSTHPPRACDSSTHAHMCAFRWESSGYFAPSGDGEPFVISMPPPNVTGALHMGHAMFVTLQDVMVRWARMNGKAALWVPGARE